MKMKAIFFVLAILIIVCALPICSEAVAATPPPSTTAPVALQQSTSDQPTTSQQYEITSSAGTGGSISPSGSVTVNSGASQTYTITPNSGYTVSAVIVDGTNVGAVNSYTFSNVAANHVITAVFTPSTYTITLSPQSSTLTSGSSQTFNVNINPAAPPGGAVISLSSNSALVTVPGSVTVPANANSANFVCTAAATITAPQLVTITSVFNGKSATASVTLLPSQVASPTFTPASGTYNSPLTATISDSTPGATIYYTADGTTPNASSPVYTGPITVDSTTTLNAIANQGGALSSISSATYTIVPTAPVASFDTNTTSGTVPLTIQFTDTSANTPTSWNWNFGDNTTSTTENPSHAYTTPGIYQVTLTAANAGGNNVSKTTTITVNPPLTITSVSNLTSFVGQKVNLTANVLDSFGNLVSGGNVSFKVNGVVVGFAAVSKGLAVLNWTVPKSWSVGTYNIIANYLGTNNYSSSVGLGKLTVDTPTSVWVAPVLCLDDRSVNLCAWLTSKCKFLANQTLEFSINGKFIGSAVTNSCGMAALKYTPTTDGWFTITATYFGNTMLYYANTTGSDILIALLNKKKPSRE